MKKILKTKKPKMLLSLFLVMVMLPISSKISANAVVEHYFTGGFPSVDGVYYTYSSGTASTYRNDVINAADRWSNASSHVDLVLNTGVSSQGIPIAQIVVSVMQYTPEAPDKSGLTIPYKSFTPNSASQADYNSTTKDYPGTWVKAFCYVYRCDAFLDTHVLLSERRNAIRKATTHEMGHALSLKHPSSLTTPAVMQQGYDENYNLRYYDTHYLKEKWGT